MDRSVNLPAPIRICFLISFLFAVSVSGCSQKTSSYSVPVPSEYAPTPEIREAEFCRFQAGMSLNGRPIEAEVMGNGHDTVLIIASIHGNERAGERLVRRLSEHLKNYPKILEGRRVIMVPALNPDGMALNSRYNARGVDLNRNFNSDNRINSAKNGLYPLSEPETEALVMIIERYKPVRIISIHQPLGCIDYDGPDGKDLAVRMSELSNLPVRKLGKKPGSLGSYAGTELNIAVVTYELSQDADRMDIETLWNTYGIALAASILFSQEAK